MPMNGGGGLTPRSTRSAAVNTWVPGSAAASPSLDAENPGVRPRRAHECDVQLAPGAQVVDVPAPADQETGILQAANALSDYVGDGILTLSRWMTAAKFELVRLNERQSMRAARIVPAHTNALVGLPETN